MVFEKVNSTLCESWVEFTFTSNNLKKEVRKKKHSIYNLRKIVYTILVDILET